MHMQEHRSAGGFVTLGAVTIRLPSLARRSLLAGFTAAICIPSQLHAAQPTSPSVMRGAIRSSSGISFAPELPKPTPAAGQVLLRVVAAGINPADYKIPKFIGGKVVGLEAAGVVEAVGPEVTSFGKGDEVFGFTVMGNGGLAEFALADVKKICKKPAALPWASAGSMPTTFLTGYQSLVEIGDLQKGGSVLIIGASGGCGTAGVQLAKAMGASEVVAVCSEPNQALVTRLGASRCVDYRDAQAYQEMVGTSKFDVVYDCATGSGGGEDYAKDAQRMLKPGGTAVAINGGAGAWLRLLCGFQSPSAKMMLTRQNGEQLGTILELLGADKSDPVIVDSTFALSEEGVREGFARLKSRRAKGKVVFEPGATGSGQA